MQKHYTLLIGFMLWVLVSMAQPLLVNGPYINELSQGPSGAEEFVEIMVYGDVNCNDTCFDLRGWILDDNNGYFASGGGTGELPQDPTDLDLILFGNASVMAP